MKSVKSGLKEEVEEEVKPLLFFAFRRECGEKREKALNNKESSENRENWRN